MLTAFRPISQPVGDRDLVSMHALSLDLDCGKLALRRGGLVLDYSFRTCL